MTNAASVKPLFDLEERTAKFSENIIDFCKTSPENTIKKPLISQLVRSATSVSAYYCEADEAGSKKDFMNKLTIAKKEAKETKHCTYSACSKRSCTVALERSSRNQSYFRINHP